ncbi:MAG: glycosyltransferase family 9 protein [Gemmatimonadetes bacterium]|nr:glycosyltransferase family 9 protein [Gemmatimonadota bacterium]
MSEAPDAVLVCRLSAIGDLVLTLPVVSALRRTFPAARLEYLSREPFGRILRDVSAIDALHLWPGPGHPPPAAVTAREWDVVVDLSASGRSRRLLAAVKRRRLLRARKQPLARFGFVRLRALGFRGAGIRRAVDRQLETIAPLGIEVGPESRRPRFDVPEPPPEGPLLIAPGAGRPTKCWPAERFRDIARRAVERGRAVRVLGSARERELADEVAQGLPPDRVRVAIAEDPAALPGLVAGCPVALGNDSAITHVAEACGAAAVVLFGPTHPAFGFGPLDPRSTVLSVELDCRPCDLHGPPACPRGHHRCLRDLSVDDVWDAVAARLGRAG